MDSNVSLFLSLICELFLIETVTGSMHLLCRHFAKMVETFSHAAETPLIHPVNSVLLWFGSVGNKQI